LNHDDQLLAELYARRNEPSSALPSPYRLAPIPLEERNPASIPAGEATLRAGQVAVLLVAGGQGSRLGFDKPKGMFPIGPVSGMSLFEIHALKVLALRRRYNAQIPFLIMTSAATHDDTVAFFEEHKHFGLDDVTFFQQGMMPALDLATGEPLLEAPGKVFMSPNGHGGTLTALADTGLLKQMKARGIGHFFYFQVDNPLVDIADPAFVGRHLETESDASSKVVIKERPEEKVGLFALIDGRCGMIEYSDLPKQLAEARTADGPLLYRAGNPAIHIFSLAFLEKVTSGSTRLQYHLAKKKVPYYDSKTKTMITPSTENALKFELFIFDALPQAERWLAVTIPREDEFAPVKNAEGVDSPATAKAMIIALAQRKLQARGIKIMQDVPVEIQPTFDLSSISTQHITQPTFFQ
jgi:UDP-N-acetylglucosamine/UDP-N-acetylgalactosamine diphosphorylase